MLVIECAMDEPHASDQVFADLEDWPVLKAK